MNIPKYVQDLMSRSEYDFRHANNPNYETGYTIRIYKYSNYQHVDTLRKEVEQLVNWANRVAGVPDTACLIYVPEKNHHYYLQSAVVTILDPVMQKIEYLIPTN